MNKMKEVAKLLGVELGEEFYLSGRDCKYRLEEEGLFYYGKKWHQDEKKWNCISGISLLDGILTDAVRIEWKPKLQEEYYYPSFESGSGYDWHHWKNDEIDNNIKRTVGIYKTKQQAQEKARELGWLE